MIKIEMEVWKVFGTGSIMVDKTETVIEDSLVSMLEVADDLCGSLERCRKNGVKTWTGKATCAACDEEQAADAEAFIEKHGLDAFAAILNGKHSGGSPKQEDWCIEYKFHWESR